MLLVLLLAITAVAYGGKITESDTDQLVPRQYIYGGSDAPINTTRHQVKIELYSRWINQWRIWCGGSIVGNYTILTADHCVDGNSPLEYYRIIVNEHDRQIPGDIYYVVEKKLHSKSITQIYHQDVALLKTDNQLPTEYIIQFPDPNEDFTGQTCTATGWGSVTYWPRNHPNILQIGEGKIMPFKECRKIMTDGNAPKAEITKKAICFGGGPDGTVSHCTGDSGGPLVCDGKLAGVLSWGDHYCRPEYPTVFMAVSKHLGWILDNHFG